MLPSHIVGTPGIVASVPPNRLGAPVTEALDGSKFVRASEKTCTRRVQRISSMVWKLPTVRRRGTSAAAVTARISMRPHQAEERARPITRAIGRGPG